MLLIWLSTFLFAAIHSLLATGRCKRWLLVGNGGLTEVRYRLVYTILSLFLTAIWLIYIHSLPDLPLYRADGLLFYILVCVQLLGLMVAVVAFRPIDTLAFLGIRAADNDVDPFIISGIYRYLRHPMYSGVMLVLFASPWQSVNSLNMALAVSAYFLIGSRLEEHRMIARHPDYAAYRKRVPAFIPRI
ncbi:MAG: NnrU family protein [Mariprofundaceae bacterium]